MPVPDDNPTTPAGVALGRMLFYDPILSGDSTLSCAGCHRPERAFGDSGPFSLGIDGIEGARNTPPVINAGWIVNMFWDGRAGGLEAQALEPVPNEIEMHLAWEDAESRLQSHATYPALFAEVFGTDVITRDLVVKAIAQFERSMISNDAKYDRWLQGQADFTESELNGWILFFTEIGDCFHCHGVNPLFTDNLFHNTGLDSILTDLGRYEVTGEESDRGLFKTPTLRNIEFTAPYMHDGRFATLEQVVQHYNSGGFFTPSVDPLIRVNVGLELSATQVQDLVAFLKTLSDPGFLQNPDYANPFD
jgi:cytochrome c peroxidase